MTAQSQAASELGAPASIIKEESSGKAALDAQEAAIRKAEARKYNKKKSSRRKPTPKKKGKK
jgi:beta-galactosidase